MEFTKTLANTIDKPLFLPNVPSKLMKLIFGEMAVLLLKGSRVSSQKIIDKGYVFSYPNLEKTPKNLTIE